MSLNFFNQDDDNSTAVPFYRQEEYVEPVLISKTDAEKRRARRLYPELKKPKDLEPISLEYRLAKMKRASDKAKMNKLGNFIKGYINENDIKEHSEDYGTVSQYLAEHPESPAFRENPDFHGPFGDLEPVRPDLSNLRNYDEILLGNPRYGADRMEKIWNDEFIPKYALNRINIQNAKDAAKVIGAGRNILSAMKDWSSYLDADNLVSSYYDISTDRRNLPNDAQVLAECFANSGGDLRKALEGAIDAKNNRKLSSHGYEALMSLVGFRMPVGEGYNPAALADADVARLVNAYEKAHELYDIGTDKESENHTAVDWNDPENRAGDPRYSSVWDLENQDLLRRGIQKSKAFLDRLTTGNSSDSSADTFANGGAIRVPKYLRDEYGRKLVRVPGWGDDDTDVYF